MEAIIGVSKRHIHLTEEVYKILFGQSNIEKRNDLFQPGQYASTSTVDIKWNDIIITHVRVIGPFRNYNQVEISESDACLLGIMPPRRQSGVLKGSLPIELIGPKGTVSLKEGVILAERHLHIDIKEALSLGIQYNDKISVYKDGSYIFNAKIKPTNLGVKEIHIDSDEAESYNLATGDKVEVQLCGK